VSRRSHSSRAIVATFPKLTSATATRRSPARRPAGECLAINAIAAVVATCAEEQHEDILLAKASVPDREQALFLSAKLG
jgi:hypothetical protein